MANNDAAAKPANKGLAKPMNLSPELQAVVGAGPMPRTQVTKLLWAYIKENNLQDPNNKRNINADEKLKKVFGQDSANMFEMTKLVSKHLS
jgi:chromatin remodeling complex protein RSC6